MNRNRSLRTTHSRPRVAELPARQGAATLAAAAFPRVLSATLLFVALTGPGMLPGVYAQTTTKSPAAGKASVKPSAAKDSTTGPKMPPHQNSHGRNPENADQIKWAPTPVNVEIYRNSLRTAPYKQIDPRSYSAAVAQRDRMPVLAGGPNNPFTAKQQSTSAQNYNGPALRWMASTTPRINITSSTGLWFPLGPYRRFPSQDHDQGQLPVAGRVNAIDYAKDSSGIFYIATASGGVWKWDPNNVDNVPIYEPNLDSHWTHYSDSQFATPETSSVAVDPTDHRIVYVGMGDYDGNGRVSNEQVQSNGGLGLGAQSPNYGSGYGLGIMKTVNGGATWYNIGNGNPLASAPGFGLTTSATPIMEGTAVSGIVVNPLNTKNIIATSGRGVNPGAIWYSNDRGNTWTQAKISGGGTITGDWSSIDVSNLDGTTGNLKFYATREYDGVYSSSDGVTWTKLPAPLIYNGTGLGGVLGIKVVCSKLTYPQSLNKGERIVYVIDASQSNRDGRVFKTDDGGQTWIDITGTYPSPTGQVDNSWGYAGFALSGAVAQVPVQGNGSASNPLRNLLIDQLNVGTKYFANSTGAIEPTGPTGPKYISTPGGVVTQQADAGAAPDFIIPTNFYDTNTPPALIVNADEHGYQQDPSSLAAWVNGTQTFVSGMMVGDGGIYPNQTFQGFYQLDSSLNELFYNSPSSQFVVPGSLETTMNDQLVISQMLNGDFFEVGDNISVRASTINNTIATTDDAQTPATQGASYPSLFAYQPDWASVTDLTNPFGAATTDWALVSYAATVATETGTDDTGVSFTTSTNPNGISDGAEPPIDMNAFPTMDTITFSPYDDTGATQAMATSAGSGSWYLGTAKRIYYTTSNWQAEPTVSGTGSLDITPDQQQVFTYQGTPTLLYIYNTVDPQDGVTGPEWGGEYHPNFGMPLVWGTAPNVSQNLPQWVPTSTAGVDVEQISVQAAQGTSPCLYTGSTYLWRFDPPGSQAYPPQPGPQPPQPTSPPYPTAPASTVYWPFTVGPNMDHGIWRRMGTTQLAAGTDADHISAIAVGANGTVYVGTTTGALWVTTDDAGRLGSDYENLPQGVQLPPLLPTWYQIAGPGVANNSLPNRPITSIVVNTDTTTTAYGDILVTLAGAPGAGGTKADGSLIPGRVYRATNAVGALPNAPVFVNTSGTLSSSTYAFLPDVPVYSVARDPDDQQNVYYAATDLGVFTTIDGGSTWTNATAPLGLPNVAATGIKVLQDTTTLNKTLAVSTYGRGAWGFDLTNLSATIAKPNLTFSTTYNRTGTQIIVNMKITNQAPSTGAAFGTAYNVTLNTAALFGQTGTQVAQAYTNISNPTGTLVTSANPIKVGTIGLNQTVYVTFYFSGASIRTGTLADLKVTGTYAVPPIPPGTTTSFTNTGALTHLP